MALRDIQQKILSLEKYFQAKRDPGPHADTPATAVIENGLRCRVQSPDGKEIYTDMSASLGGTATANSPGWLSRAAIASCDATLLAIRAARQGIELDTIEVNVDASSDGRGMILDDGISPGSSEIRVCFNVGAANATVEQVRELVDWVVAHSPVGTDIARAVDVSVELVTASESTVPSNIQSAQRPKSNNVYNAEPVPKGGECGTYTTVSRSWKSPGFVDPRGRKQAGLRT